MPRLNSTNKRIKITIDIAFSEESEKLFGIIDRAIKEHAKVGVSLNQQVYEIHSSQGSYTEYKG